MNILKSKVAIVLLGFVMLEACAKVPITGRRQLNLVSEGEMMAMANTQYAGFLGENQPLPPANDNVVRVRTIGEKLAAAATKFLADNNASNRINGFDWQFNVVDDPTVNAWCMPGGKVVVYTGILPVTQNDNGLAVVMGHEIAHAIARHGNERMSQAVTAQGLGTVLSVANDENPTLVGNIFLQSYGIGSQLGLLAYGRKQESEADKMGLVFMAMAGYDPREAPIFWERMSAGGGAAPPEILSTHPSDERRVADLNAYMDEALKYYKP
ncbi:MAG: M48 family metallopeptidase [Flavobacteriales bacterium]|nr:M48 family metallopeptidase [Flavobacteriales bacterium]HQV53705.1 M48 family metallopeptidase [Flavobacteriales bacterium]HQX30866.1 M48 family metallopeptidase [Flavobacteriales bacterium]HQX39333.1 M48 family metallopeptidase [Flavobacteriales bacterium]